MTRPAIVLLSGGLDSTTVLAIALSRGFEPHAISFEYGQRHSIELEAAARVAQAQGVADHQVFHIDPALMRGSALTDRIDVPKHASADELVDDGIPVTYVPARNTVFLAHALARAEVVGSTDIFLGVNALDYSGYPDCRPEFIEAFETMANLATKAAVEGARLKIHAPLIRMTKADIIRTGLALNVDYSLTSSCYDPDSSGRACGQCDSCLLRLKGFREAGSHDPVPYQASAA